MITLAETYIQVGVVDVAIIVTIISLLPAILDLGT